MRREILRAMTAATRHPISPAISQPVTNLEPCREGPVSCLRTGADSGTMRGRYVPQESGPLERGSLMPRARKHSGFSLIELLIVVTIALVLVAFAVPNFIQVMRNFRIGGDSSSISSDILTAKMRAAANFTAYRVYFDLDAKTFRPQMWCKAAVLPCLAGDVNTWKNVAVGAPQFLSTGVDFGVGNQSSPPAVSGIATQTTFGQAPTCKQGAAGGVPWAPGAGSNESGNSACVMFNSRGFPVDNNGTATGENAIYINNIDAIHGVTVSVTGLARVWRHDRADVLVAHWFRR
jgi:prepilin-type N-terminal cleavage/methylation domain-containing protein